MPPPNEPGPVGGLDLEAAREQELFVAVEDVLEEDRQVSRGGARPAQPGDVGGALEGDGVQGHAEADRGLAVEERLLQAEQLVVNLEVLDRRPLSLVHRGVEIIEVVERGEETVLGHGALVVGDLQPGELEEDRARAIGAAVTWMAVVDVRRGDGGREGREPRRGRRRDPKIGERRLVADDTRRGDRGACRAAQAGRDAPTSATARSRHRHRPLPPRAGGSREDTRARAVAGGRDRRSVRIGSPVSPRHPGRGSRNRTVGTGRRGLCGWSRGAPARAILPRD